MKKQRKGLSPKLKAAFYTLLIVGLLGLIFFTYTWVVPHNVEVQPGETLEVNMGNAESGSGKDLTANDAAANSASDEDTKVEEPVLQPTVHTQSVDGPPVSQAGKAAAAANHHHAASVPVPPRPKAIYQGGGYSNNASDETSDSYTRTANEGITEGLGNQGKPNGSAISTRYTGNGASGNGSALTIREGLTGRRFLKIPSFEDDFNENAKVAVDIQVNAAGSVVSARVNNRGTTTTNPKTKLIAIQKATQLKLNSSNAEQQTGTVVFVFTLKE